MQQTITPWYYEAKRSRGYEKQELMLVASILSKGFIGISAIIRILFECAHHPSLPRVDRIAFELERINEADDILNRHAMAQYPRNEFGIVPILLVEACRKPFNGGLVASSILE